MKKFKIDNYFFKGSLGEGFFEVEIVVHKPIDLIDKNDLQNIDHSIPIQEIDRIERLIALDFFIQKYSQIQKGEYHFSAKEISGICDILNVNRIELAQILGSHKGTITNIFKGRPMSVSLSILLLERLATELFFPGITRGMIDGKYIVRKNDDAIEKINLVRTKTAIPQVAA